MQDASVRVREVFTARLTALLLQPPTAQGGALPVRFLAVLALAANDPHAPLRDQVRKRGPAQKK